MHGYEYKIPDHRVLTRAEEIAVFKVYRKSNSCRAINFIVEHNLKFAIHCANAYITKYPHVDPMDLRSYAMLGLYEAIEKYDIDSNVKFISYAVWWIKATIIRNVQTNESLVRLPANIHQALQQSVNKKDFTCELLNMFNTIGGGMSMDANINKNGDSITLGETIADEKAYEQFNKLENDDLHDKLFSIIDECLTDREKYVVLEHFGLLNGDKRTLASIGKELHMSREHARNIKNKAFQKMLKLLKNWK